VILIGLVFFTLQPVCILLQHSVRRAIMKWLSPGPFAKPATIIAQLVSGVWLFYWTFPLLWQNPGSMEFFASIKVPFSLWRYINSL
jgi:hypothetical protein